MWGLFFRKTRFIWENPTLSADNVGFFKKPTLSERNPYYLIITLSLSEINLLYLILIVTMACHILLHSTHLQIPVMKLSWISLDNLLLEIHFHFEFRALKHNFLILTNKWIAEYSNFDYTEKILCMGPQCSLPRSRLQLTASQGNDHA